MKEKINKTNVARLLDKAKIAYELVPYEVDENDLSATHVAEQLGVSVNTVKTQVKVAYKKIKSEFGDRDKNFMLILCNSFFKEEAGQ